MMARLMAVDVSSHLWQEMATQGWEVGGDGRKLICTGGLPEGAELVNSYYDGQRRTAVLVFHHPSFDDVSIGAVIPKMALEYSLVKINDA